VSGSARSARVVARAGGRGEADGEAVGSSGAADPVGGVPGQPEAGAGRAWVGGRELAGDGKVKAIAVIGDRALNRPPLVQTRTLTGGRPCIRALVQVSGDRSEDVVDHSRGHTGGGQGCAQPPPQPGEVGWGGEVGDEPGRDRLDRGRGVGTQPPQHGQRVAVADVLLPAAAGNTFGWVACAAVRISAGSVRVS
jgi:hypothetical protein